MMIQRIDPAQLKKVYNIWCQGLYPSKMGPFFPFGSTYCEIEPLGYSAKHAHHENETFLILEGQGSMEIAGEKAGVSAGDVILIPALSAHRLDNLASTGRLRFISIYWSAPLIATLPKELLVIPAPPTPNGPLHVGHLSGPYLAGDVFTRYAALRGFRAFYAVGTDDNQCYVPAKGRQLGLTGKEVADQFVPTIMGALKNFGSKVHHELHPLGVDEHARFIQRTFTDLARTGAVELRKVRAPFCEDAGRFLYGAEISGGCPHCGRPTNGNGCEACGAYNDCGDLVHPTSNIGKGPVSLREVEKYYFPLSRYGEKLEPMLERVAMHPRLRSFYLQYLQRGLPDVAVSQFGSWGISCPDRPGQILYEWFEMAGSYLYMADQIAQKHSTGRFWEGAESAVVECFGIDNSFFYGFLVPALMMEMTPRFQPPKAFLFNFFYQLDGKKFSTSRNHAVWADDILASVPADVLRFYLALTRSEDKETNFNLDDFAAFVRSELVGRWQTLLHDFDADLEQLGRVVPAHEGALTAEQERFLHRLNRLIHEIHECYSLEHFSLNRAARRLNELATEIAEYFDRSRGNATGDGLDMNALNVTTQGLRAWAAALCPIMPDFGGRLTATLGGTTAKLAVAQSAEALKVGKLPTAELGEALLRLGAFQKKNSGR